MHLSLFSSKLTEALGWTLLHSLWQGAVIALLMAAALFLLNRQSAQVRYLVAVSALALMVIAAGTTFCTLYVTRAVPLEESLTSVDVAPAMPGVLAQNSISTEVKTPETWQDLLTQWTGYLEQNAPLIVMVWLLGILVLSLRFIGGLLYVQRLKQYKTQPVASEWTHKVQVLGEQLGLSRAVRLLESGLVNVPMAIGYFKPVILLPVGTFTGLTPSQVEAILAHELAHIVRNDHWVNIFQSIVEILFFFHPAVWWISGMVRQEREHCCDDVAVQLSGDSLTFAQALTHLEVMQTVPQLALPATGNRGSLLGRIQRLLQQSPQKPSLNEGMLVSGIVGLCLIAISASAFSSLNSSETQIPQNSISQSAKTPSSDSLSNKTTFYSTFTDTSKVVREIVIVKDKKGTITEVTVDGRKLSGNELKSYRQIIDQKINKSNANDEDVNMTIHENNVGLFPPAPVPPVPPLPPDAAPEPIIPLPPVPSEDTYILPPVPPVPPFESNEEIQRMNNELKKLQQELCLSIQANQRQIKEAGQKADKTGDLKRWDNIYQELKNAREEADKQYHDQVEFYLKQLREYEKELEKQLQASSLYASNVYEARKLAWDERTQEFRQQMAEIEMSEAKTAEDQEKARQKYEQAERERTKAAGEHKKYVEFYNKLAEKNNRLFVQELKKDGLIQSEEIYSFLFTKTRFYVNDKVQPEITFQKYKGLLKTLLGEDIDKWKNVSEKGWSKNWKGKNGITTKQVTSRDEEQAVHIQQEAAHKQAMAEHEKSMVEHKKAMEKHEKFIQLLVGELKKDGLIANEKSYSIQISRNKLYVNDKEQPEKVFLKYKELIKRETGEDLDKWDYSQKMQINSNWEKRSTDQSLLKPYLWDLNKLMGKPEPKNNC